MSPRQQLQEKSLWIFTRTVRGCSARTVTLTFSWSESGGDGSADARQSPGSAHCRRAPATGARRHCVCVSAGDRVRDAALPGDRPFVAGLAAPRSLSLLPRRRRGGSQCSGCVRRGTHRSPKARPHIRWTGLAFSYRSTHPRKCLPNAKKLPAYAGSTARSAVMV